MMKTSGLNALCRLRFNLVPLKSDDPDQQADIDLIHDLVNGKAAPWDEQERAIRRQRALLCME